MSAKQLIMLCLAPFSPFFGQQSVFHNLNETVQKNNGLIFNFNGGHKEYIKIYRTYIYRRNVHGLLFTAHLPLFS
jgi:hypothetical protein